MQNMQNVQISSNINCIILDIDNTLVHSINPNLVHYDWLKKFKTVMSKDFCIFLRPKLEEFLDYIFSKYTVGVFSAGDSEYVNFVVKNIIENNNRKVYFTLCNKDFDTCKFETGEIKSIKWVSQKFPLFTIDNTMIIDDYFLVKVSNPKNTILVNKFEICSEIKSNIEINQIVSADNKYILLEKLYNKDAEKDNTLEKFL